MKTAIVCSILLLGNAVHAQSQPALSPDDIAKQFSGMWRLVSNPQRFKDGTTRAGSNTVGYAFFDTNANHMCFLSMNPDRPRWKSENAPAPEEAVSAIRGFGAYCAVLEIHAKEGFMVRHYDLNQSPNAVGRTTKRWYTFDGPDHMSLRVDSSELNGNVAESTFVWERLK